MANQSKRKVELLRLIAEEGTKRGMTPAHEVTRLKSELQLVLGERVYEVWVRETEELVASADIWSQRAKTGRLQIRLEGPGLPGWSGKHYYETKTINIESRLPKMFEDIRDAQPVHDAREEVWRIDRERRALEETLRQERQRVSAVFAAREKVVLDAQLRWARTKDLREYLLSVEERAQKFEGVQASEAAEWIEWVRRYIQKIDPVNDDLRLPTDLPTN